MADRIDNKAFAEMQYATADKTAIDLLGDKAKVTSKDVHTMLMAAGLTPAVGNLADLADALLYTVEGEFGEAALSFAAMIPMVGQIFSGKRGVNIAKKILDRAVPTSYGQHTAKFTSKDPLMPKRMREGFASREAQKNIDIHRKDVYKHMRKSLKDAGYDIP
tara:strand:- start:131 stop:616 length:486 start_codon:yes stop_codon:yes gene_type:complete